MASVFTKIINNELPAYRIYEDEHVIAILALDQVTEGHTLVIPKTETNHWFEVPEADYLAVAKVAKKIAPALKKVTGCSRVLTAAIGFEVPHYHLHLIPANQMSQFNFALGKKLSAERMIELQKSITSELQS